MLARTLSYGKTLSAGNIVLGVLLASTSTTCAGLLLYRSYKTRQPVFRAREQATLARIQLFVHHIKGLQYQEEQQSRSTTARQSPAVSTSFSSPPPPLLVLLRSEIFREHAHCFSVLAENNMSSWSSDVFVLELRQLAQSSLAASVKWMTKCSELSQQQQQQQRSVDRSSGFHDSLHRLLTSAENHGLSIGWRLQMHNKWLEWKLKMRGVHRAVKLTLHLLFCSSSTSSSSSCARSDAEFLSILAQKNYQLHDELATQFAVEKNPVPSHHHSFALQQQKEAEAVSNIERLQREQADSLIGARARATAAPSFFQRIVGSFLKISSSVGTIFRLQRWPLVTRIALLALLEASQCALVRYNRLQYGAELGYSSVKIAGGGGRSGFPLGLELVSLLMGDLTTRFAFAIDLQVSRLFSRHAAYAIAMADTVAMENFNKVSSSGGGDHDGGKGSNSNNFFSSAGYSKCLEEVRDVGNKAVFCISGLVQLSVQIAFIGFDVGYAVWNSRRGGGINNNSSTNTRTSLLCLGIAIGWYLFDDGLLCNLVKKLFRTPRKILQEFAFDMTADGEKKAKRTGVNSNNNNSSCSVTVSGSSPSSSPLPSAFSNDDVEAVVCLDRDERAILSDAHGVASRVPALALGKETYDEPISDEVILTLRVLGLDVVATLCGLQRRQRTLLRSLVSSIGAEILDPHSNILSELLTLLRRYVAFHVAAWYLAPADGVAGALQQNAKHSLSSSSSSSSSPLSLVSSFFSLLMSAVSDVRAGRGVDVARGIGSGALAALSDARRIAGEIAAAEPSLVVGHERWVTQVEYYLCSFDDVDMKFEGTSYFLNLEHFSVLITCLLADASIDRVRSSSDDVNFIKDLVPSGKKKSGSSTNNNSSKKTISAFSVEFKNVSFDYCASSKNSALVALAASKHESEGSAETARVDPFRGAATRFAEGERASQIFSVSDASSCSVTTTAAAAGVPQDKNNSAQLKAETVARALSATPPVLNNLNFKIRAGEILGVIGTSGIGKSTLFRLILRIYDPSSGQILIGHSTSSKSSSSDQCDDETGDTIDDAVSGVVDLASIKDVRAWRRNGIAYVDQHPLICSDATVRENVEFGRPLPTEVVEQALRDACCMGFVQRLKRGMDSAVGFRLSSGERQRLAIARAFARRAPLLLLDESTAMLDAETESAVVRGCVARHYTPTTSFDQQQQQQGELPLSETTTTIIVAHRLATLKVAHRILVLDNHGVAGLGTHRELMDTCPQYRQVYDRQCILKDLARDVASASRTTTAAAPAASAAADNSARGKPRQKQPTPLLRHQRDIKLLQDALRKWTGDGNGKEAAADQARIKLLQQYLLQVDEVQQQQPEEEDGEEAEEELVVIEAPSKRKRAAKKPFRKPQ